MLKEGNKGMSIVSVDYVCGLDGNCYHAVNQFCQMRQPQECKYSRRRCPSINEYFNTMPIADKAGFFADVMACAACPKKDGCENMDKASDENAHQGCMQRMDEWLHETVQKEA